MVSVRHGIGKKMVRERRKAWAEAREGCVATCMAGEGKRDGRHGEVGGVSGRARQDE